MWCGMTGRHENDVLEDLRGFDREAMTELARSVVGDPVADIAGGWSCSALSAVSIGNGTLGFFKVEGSATSHDGTLPWSVVVKIMEPLAEDANLANSPAREIQAYESDFVSVDRPGRQAAACYRVDHRPDGTVWLWLQDLSRLKRETWTTRDYLSAAKQIGLFNGSCPEAEANGMDWIDRSGVSDRRKGPISAEKQSRFQRALSEPMVQRTAVGIGMDRAARLYDDVLKLVDASSAFPKIISHNDCHTRNLFLEYGEHGSDGDDVLYAIDWASVGLTPVGVDGGTFVASGFTWGREEAEVAAGAEALAFDAYFEGLINAGWQQPKDEVRLVFLTVAATYALQNMNVIYQGTTNERWEKMLTARIAPTLEQVADEFSERQQLMIPLVDEALSLISA